ncbi:hypothetical protein HRH25_20995 [Flavisolibacter sp. BT320]|nr:hypothetical protein [Flavisolibacter longurius]
MKKLYAAVFFLMLSLPKILIAQEDSSGIYITPEDFASKKLSYAIDCNTEKHRINSDLIFKGSKIKVKHDGQKYTLDKSKTFGYRSCDQQVYRFVGNLSYKILNPQESLLLYFYQHLAHAPKFVEQHPPQYFFSVGPGVVQKLTVANVKASYPDNHAFHDAVDLQFKSDKDLYAYDDFHKMYKLNWILKQNTQ